MIKILPAKGPLDGFSNRHGLEKQNSCGTTGTNVFLYPVEYLTYGTGNNLTTRANGQKEYKLMDHLGSTRVVLDNNGITQEYDYDPFGRQVVVTAATTGGPVCEGFIGKEKDSEDNLGDFGVRKYDESLGRFMSTDVLWEKYRGLTPYQYGDNSPLIKSDPSGAIIIFKLGDGATESDLNKLKEWYNKLKKAGGFASKLIKHLEDSKYTHIIRAIGTDGKEPPAAASYPGTDGNYGESDKISEARLGGKGCGSIVQMDPDKLSKEAGSGYVQLGAELAHSYLYDVGMSDEHPWSERKGFNPINHDEIIVHAAMENKIRKQFGISPRLYYGWVNLEKAYNIHPTVVISRMLPGFFNPQFLEMIKR